MSGGHWAGVVIPPDKGDANHALPIRKRWTEDEAGCWIWSQHKDRDGYGRDGNEDKAHRVVYEAIVGPIPVGLVLDHLCRVRACVNPGHMEPVTSAENTRRGINATKTHCSHGHPFDEANTYVRKLGHRGCRACHRRHVAESSARRRAKRRAENTPPPTPPTRSDPHRSNP